LQQSIIVRAQGEARSAELISDAIKANKGFLELRKLEAARDIAAMLGTSGNKVVLDANTLLLNGKPILPRNKWNVERLLMTDLLMTNSSAGYHPQIKVKEFIVYKTMMHRCTTSAIHAPLR
jgi:hypothetical protein